MRFSERQIILLMVGCGTVSFVDEYQLFGETYCFYVHDRRRCLLIHTHTSLTELKTVILKHNRLKDHTLLVFQNTVIIIIIIIIIIWVLISRTQPEYYLLFISKTTLMKTTTCFGLYFHRLSSGRKYPFSRKTVQRI